MKRNFKCKRIIAALLGVGIAVMPSTAFAGTFTDLQYRLDTEIDIELEEDYIRDPENDGDTALTVWDGTSVNLNLNGYTIDGNGGKGVFFVEDNASLTIDDTSKDKTGTITGGNNIGEKDSNSGGGICVRGDDDENGQGGSLTLKDGTITGNTASYGGGVFVNEGGSFDMQGGTVTDNTAECGGGVYDAGNMSISGKATIKDNHSADGLSDDLALITFDGETPAGHPIQVGKMDPASKVYFTTWNWEDVPATGVLTQDYTKNNPGAGLEDFFIYNGWNEYHAKFTDDGQEIEVVEASGDDPQDDPQNDPQAEVKLSAMPEQVVVLSDNPRTGLANSAVAARFTVVICLLALAGAFVFIVLSRNRK